MNEADSSADAERDAERCKHLRTIQFSLFAICVGIAIVLLSDRSSPVSRARTQLDDILSLSEGPTDWLLPAVKTFLKDRDAIRPLEGSFDVDGREFVYEAGWGLYRITNSRLVHVGGFEDPSGQYHIAGDYLSLDIATLAGFAVFWDAIHEPHMLVVPKLIKEEGAVLVGLSRKRPFGPSRGSLSDWTVSEPIEYMGTVYGPAPSKRTYEFKEKPSRSVDASQRTNGSPLPVAQLPEPVRDLLSDSDKWVVYLRSFHGPLPDDSINATFVFFPAEVNVYQVDLQQLLKRKFDKPKGKRGKFSYTFRDVNEITKDYQELPPKTIATILQGEAERSGERLHVFGATVPSEIVYQWGALILLGIQVYFWLHYTQFVAARNTPRERINVPWIGLYSDHISTAVFFTTSYIIPNTLIGWLFIHAIRTGPQWFTVVVVVVVFIVMLLTSIKCVALSIKDMRRQ